MSAPARTSGRGVGVGCPGGGWARGGDAGTEAVAQLVVYRTFFFFQFSYILFKLNIKKNLQRYLIFLMVGLKECVYSDEGEINKKVMMAETVGSMQCLSSMSYFLMLSELPET